MDSADLDLEDLPPKALRKLIKSLLMKKGKPNDAKQSEEADEEREALSDLHEEKKGKTEGVPVDETDMPFDLGSDSEEDEDDSEDGDDSQGSEAGVKPPPFAKKGKKKGGK